MRGGKLSVSFKDDGLSSAVFPGEVLVAECQENELNFLERLDERIGCTHGETVAVVTET